MYYQRLGLVLSNHSLNNRRFLHDLRKLLDRRILLKLQITVLVLISYFSNSKVDRSSPASRTTKFDRSFISSDVILAEQLTHLHIRMILKKRKPNSKAEVSIISDQGTNSLKYCCRVCYGLALKQLCVLLAFFMIDFWLICYVCVGYDFLVIFWDCNTSVLSYVVFFMQFDMFLC
ncbi:hypothetical protein V2J09_000491 [Rumex salicifolius]